MGIHKNVLLTPAGREILVRRVRDEGQTPISRLGLTGDNLMRLHN